jgi:hypothetical protein
MCPSQTNPILASFQTKEIFYLRDFKKYNMFAVVEATLKMSLLQV